MREYGQLNDEDRRPFSDWAFGEDMWERVVNYQDIPWEEMAAIWNQRNGDLWLMTNVHSELLQEIYACKAIETYYEEKEIYGELLHEAIE